MLLMRGALSSGAVSSSWIWNLLTAVFTVTWLLASGSASGRHFALQSPYVAFTLLLAAYLLDVSYTDFGGRFQAASDPALEAHRFGFLYPYYGFKHPSGSFAYRCGLPQHRRQQAW